MRGRQALAPGLLRSRRGLELTQPPSRFFPCFPLACRSIDALLACDRSAVSKGKRSMIEAMDAKLHPAAAVLSPETLRARARCRRETAARLWDEWLERLLLEEAEEFERRAAALDAEAAGTVPVPINRDETDAAGKIAQPDLAALREEAQAG